MGIEIDALALTGTTGGYMLLASITPDEVHALGMAFVMLSIFIVSILIVIEEYKDRGE